MQLHSAIRVQNYAGQQFLALLATLSWRSPLLDGHSFTCQWRVVFDSCAWSQHVALTCMPGRNLRLRWPSRHFHLNVAEIVSKTLVHERTFDIVERAVMLAAVLVSPQNYQQTKGKHVEFSTWPALFRFFSIRGRFGPRFLLPSPLMLQLCFLLLQIVAIDKNRPLSWPFFRGAKQCRNLSLPAYFSHSVVNLWPCFSWPRCGRPSRRTRLITIGQLAPRKTVWHADSTDDWITFIF